MHMSTSMFRPMALWMGALVLILASCSQPAATPAAAPTAAPAAAGQAAKPAAAAPTGTPIKVGVLDDVTGVGAIEGALMRISVELVVQETKFKPAGSGSVTTVLLAS